MVWSVQFAYGSGGRYAVGGRVTAACGCDTVCPIDATRSDDRGRGVGLTDGRLGIDQDLEVQPVVDQQH